MTKKSILLVDDDIDLCEIVSFNLEAQGYDVQVAHSAPQAMKLMDNNFDLILLDVMMPAMSGFDFAKLLKQDMAWCKIPIIFLTAKDTEEDKLTGFKLGADDYIAKPFSIREMIARVKAVLGRTAQVEQQELNTTSYKGLVVNTSSKRVTVDGLFTTLTKTEYELLLFLLEHRGKVFSREQLLENVWPNNVVVTLRTVDVNITRLRKKIGQYATNILTKTGYGYSFEP
ncbi:MAG: response regulator transcription factor [Bacteroidales bacterium]|nr:response regulator transcription factor [Muribaculaceae bacterium]MDY6293488.1 response regulator transcription factor [Bacteroidales bacterium]